MGLPPAGRGPELARQPSLVTGTGEGDEPRPPLTGPVQWRNAGESHRTQRREVTSTCSLLRPNACPTGRDSSYLAITVKSSNSAPPPPAMP